MAVRRNRADDDDGGLDSLLDTMTNVVGILVLVLIVTQISVKDVVDQVMKDSNVDAAEIEETQNKLAAVKLEEEDLKRMLIAPDDIDAERQREELQKQKDLLERRKQELAKKKQEQNQFAMKIKDDQAKAQAAKKKIADTEKQRKELQGQLSASLEQRAALKAKLSSTRRRVAPADIKVSIPNPRPPPEGARQLPIVCVGEKVYPINIDVFRKRAEVRAKEIIQRAGLKKDPAKGYDPKRFASFWERLKDQDDWVEVQYYIQGNRYLRLRFVPRDGRGGTDRQLVNPRSKIRSQYLNQLDATKYFARFYVLPDSYDVYLTARRLFNKNNVLSGWEPQSKDYVYSSWVPGGIELGPPIERKPPPPGAKPKPQNLID